MTSPAFSAQKRRMVSSALYTAAAAAVALVFPAFAQADCSTPAGYGACSIQFCMDWPSGSSTCRAAWYTVSGTRYTCTSCTNLSSCVTAAANRCAALTTATGGIPAPRPTGTTTTGSSGGSTSTGGSTSSGGGSTSSGGSSSGSRPSSSSSSNSCRYANDGECDEGSLCATGTDSSDCRGASVGSNSCQFSYDDVCDESAGLCPRGTDTYDCTHQDDGAGCSVSETAKTRGGGLDLGLPLAFGALLLRQSRRRRHPR